MSSIYYHTQRTFSERIFSQLGKGKIHARRIYAHWMQKGTLEGLEVEPQARALLDEIVSIVDFSLPEHQVAYEEDGTIKFLVKFEDGLECESVFIPMKSKNTLCISSQVGCKMGCVFCETGRMGLIRHLTTREIVAQVFIAIQKLGLRVDNIVFMGMGEPLDNFEAVADAIDVLTDPAGLRFGPSRISVSTSGLVDKIDALAERVDPAVNLAVSVNAPSDEIRRKIMPVNRTWDMAALKEAMLRFCSHPRRQIFVEYVLLKGINDSLECADQLASYLRGLKVKVNLIPYNPQSRDRFAPPEAEVVNAFSERMQSAGYLTMIRQKKGQKIMAACGQLGNLHLRRLHIQRESGRMTNLLT
ncbi:MAG: 23S rRNA (adenine(2503)-C(2))-methyltransferase RlmN [Verrucomicrobia bacterium]|nr:23S rRNA (adenine(2503)-C(2))-methyltransferase RlmN [Verrucomicrobiota bacterium]